MKNDPGYMFRLNQSLNALQNSAAARGGLLSTGTTRDLTSFASDYASNEYSNVFNRALQQYDLGYNVFENNQANLFNRLAALSGVGQTSAQQLNAAGSQAAGNVGSINATIGGQVGQNLLNSATATASGYTGAANAVNGGIGNISQIIAMMNGAQNANNPNYTLGNTSGMPQVGPDGYYINPVMT
jgi:hypothetical protein